MILQFKSQIDNFFMCNVHLGGGASQEDIDRRHA
jgi:hypothetical protein